MISIPFNVNDANLRRTFFDNMLLASLSSLRNESKAKWGKMSARHMVEHLVYTFEISTGKLEVQCKLPANIIERAKRFLSNNSFTPQNFKNPLLGDNPAPLRFSNLSEATTTLKEELNNFRNHFQEKPESINIHPLFGPLGAEDWERVNFKHCYHHLLQFDLIRDMTTEAV